jgi:zinc protease
MLSVTAFQKTNLNDVMNGINEAFKTLKPKDFTTRFRPIKAGQETAFILIYRVF